MKHVSFDILLKFNCERVSVYLAFELTKMFISTRYCSIYGSFLLYFAIQLENYYPQTVLVNLTNRFCSM